MSVSRVREGRQGRMAGGEERAAEVLAWGGGVGGVGEEECQYNLLTQQ